MPKKFPAATWSLCRDIWCFVAGRDSERTHEFASRYLPPGETPDPRTIRSHALVEDWADWAAQGPSRIAPALTSAGRDLMTLAYPEAVLTLVQAMRAGDAAAARSIIRTVDSLIDQPPATAPMPRLPSPHQAEQLPRVNELARLMGDTDDDTD